MRELRHATGYAAVFVAALSGVPLAARPLASPVVLCEIVGDSPTDPATGAARLIAGATAIVRARVIETGDRAKSNVRLETLEVLKAPASVTFPASLTVHGVIVANDDYNPGSVPYAQVRRAGLRGTCVAEEYRAGAEYLLLLTHTSQNEWTPYWAPLMPTNEQIQGSDDPWMIWVRERISAARRGSS